MQWGHYSICSLCIIDAGIHKIFQFCLSFISRGRQEGVKLTATFGLTGLGNSCLSEFGLSPHFTQWPVCKMGQQPISRERKVAVWKSPSWRFLPIMIYPYSLLYLYTCQVQVENVTFHHCLSLKQETHVSAVHNNERPYTCTTCSYICANKGWNSVSCFNSNPPEIKKVLKLNSVPTLVILRS